MEDRDSPKGIFQPRRTAEVLKVFQGGIRLTGNVSGLKTMSDNTIIVYNYFSFQAEGSRPAALQP